MRANHYFRHLVGYCEAELQRRRFQDITHPEDLGPSRGGLRQSLQGGGAA